MTFVSPGLLFGTRAASYHEGRPPLIDDAVDWLTEGTTGTVADVGAGTGSFTQQLTTRVEPVIAIEPDEGMRRELVKNCPGVTVLAGSAEQLPLDSGSIGAVLLKGVWHWLDVPRATAEIARVLSPGGRLGVCWYAPTNPAGSGRHDLFPPEVLQVVTSVHRAGHEPRRFELPVPGPFGEPEKYEREHTLRMTPPQVGALLNTYSAMMHPDFADRHHELTEVTVAFARDQAGRSGMSTVPVRFTATCYRVSRI